ncbi:response regulator [Microvirga thermotolerans]|uniref:response regulator n=1 Tax=Microvirga thermotolerans TaxID=2651334 RepID=UPI0018848A12|nr:response regulator [Microvirga thermotolerans]
MRVLILEDDPFIAMDLQALLEERAHEVVGVYSSIREVWPHLDDGFDYALLDIDLTDGKSFDVASELQERGIPFSFVSASAPQEVPAGLEQASFIAKPFEDEAILSSLRIAASALPLH